MEAFESGTNGAVPADPDNVARRPSLADKINQAFVALLREDKKPWSNREVAQWLQTHSKAGEPTISENYLAMLRSGDRDNPTVSHLRALARFFGLPASYFLDDDEDAAAMHADLRTVAAMRDAQVRQIALRAMDLDPSMRNWLHDTVTGLPVPPARQESSTERRRRRFEVPPDDAGGAE